MPTVTIERQLVERAVSALTNEFPPTQLITALRAALAAQPATNPWREALIDELVVTGIYRRIHEDHPRQAVQDVINWHTGVALDPAVSSDAQALIDRGKAAQPAEPVAWMLDTTDGKLFMAKDSKHNDDWLPLYTAPPAPAAVPPKLWLWRNFVDGRPEYWAFDNPFPVHMDCDDPQTLGEPVGYALFKPSRSGRDDVSEAEVLRRIAAAGDKP